MLIQLTGFKHIPFYLQHKKTTDKTRTQQKKSQLKTVSKKLKLRFIVCFEAATNFIRNLAQNFSTAFHWNSSTTATATTAVDWAGAAEGCTKGVGWGPYRQIGKRWQRRRLPENVFIDFYEHQTNQINSFFLFLCSAPNVGRPHTYTEYTVKKCSVVCFSFVFMFCCYCCVFCNHASNNNNSNNNKIINYSNNSNNDNNTTTRCTIILAREPLV